MSEFKYIYKTPSRIQTLQHDDLGLSDSLAHARKGEEVAGHKYTARKWVNGAWQYIYGKIGGDQLKEYRKTFDNRLLSKKSLENTYNDIEKTDDAIKKVKNDKEFIDDYLNEFKKKPELKKIGGGQLTYLAKKYNYYGGTIDEYSTRGEKYYTHDDLEAIMKKMEMQESKLKASKERLTKIYSEKADIHRNKIEKNIMAENNYKKTLLSRIKGDIIKDYTKYNN